MGCDFVCHSSSQHSADCIKDGETSDYSLPRAFARSIMRHLEEITGKNIDTIDGKISEEDYETIIVQLKSYDFSWTIVSRKNEYITRFRLTDKGEKRLLTKYYVRSKKK